MASCWSATRTKSKHLSFLYWNFVTLVLYIAICWNTNTVYFIILKYNFLMRSVDLNDSDCGKKNKFWTEKKEKENLLHVNTVIIYFIFFSFLIIAFF